MAERGVNVDHTTIYRWMQRYAPWYWFNPTDLNHWYSEETYIKVKGKWKYLYRDVDSRGYTIEFYLSPHRNTKAAYRFLRKIFNRNKKWQIPKVIIPDKAAPYSRALNLLKEEGGCPTHVEHRQIKFHKNVIECDHGKLKRVINPTLGFKSIKTAHALLKELM